MANTPEKSKEKGGQEVAAELAGRIDTLQGTVDLLKRNLDFVEGTNRFILVIVGLAFVALVISVIFGNIQALIANTNSQNQFNNSLQQILNAIKK
jgi:hypothetical protein